MILFHNKRSYHSIPIGGTEISWYAVPRAVVHVYRKWDHPVPSFTQVRMVETMHDALRTIDGYMT